MPNATVPRVQENAVSFANGPNALPLDHFLHVLGGHNSRISRDILFGYRELPSAQSHCIQENAAAHETNLRHVLYPERTQSGRANTFVVHETAIVVESPLRCADADVARPVELRADLSQFSSHILDIPNQFLGPRRRTT